MYEHIENKFGKLGALVNIEQRDRLSGFRMDVRGRTFDFGVPEGAELTVLDFDKADKHLLLLARDEAGDKSKFLAGFDEREFFISEVKGLAVNIDSAKQSMKPNAVVASQKRKKVKTKNKHKRKNKGFIRQGEWFFIPEEPAGLKELLILKKEPLMLANFRGGSKPHVAEEAYRTGGTVVYIPQVLNIQMPKGLIFNRDRLRAGITEEEKKRLRKENPETKKWKWRTMVRNPKLYIRGKLRHPDHKTRFFRSWHRVEVNDEIRGANVAFLD